MSQEKQPHGAELAGNILTSSSSSSSILQPPASRVTDYVLWPSSEEPSALCNVTPSGSLIFTSWDSDDRTSNINMAPPL